MGGKNLAGWWTRLTVPHYYFEPQSISTRHCTLASEMSCSTGVYGNGLRRVDDFPYLREVWAHLRVPSYDMLCPLAGIQADDNAIFVCRLNEPIVHAGITSRVAARVRSVVSLVNSL